MSAGSPVSLRTRVLERHDLAVAHPCAEQVGGQRRVAQLVDVRARVREPERHVVVREQVAHGVDVVVGDVGTKRVRRSSATASSHITSSGRAAAFACELGHAPALQLGELLPTPRPRTSPIAASSATAPGRPRPAPATPDRGRRRSAPSRSPCRSSPNTVPVLRLYGSASVNCIVSGRGVTCGHTCGAVRQALLVQRKRLQVLPAGRREHRVGERPPDAWLPLVDVGVGALLARRDEHHALARSPAARNSAWTSSRSAIAARDGLAVDASVRVREAGREARRAPVDRLAHERRTCARSRPRSRPARTRRRP